MSKTCPHGQDARHGCVLCFGIDNNIPGQVPMDTAIKLMESSNETSKNHKEIFERLNRLENSPFGKSDTYTPLFQRLASCRESIEGLEEKVFVELEILKDFNGETQKGFDRLILRMDCLVNRINELEVESIKPEKSALVCPGCNGKGFHIVWEKNYEQYPCKACNETGIFHQ